RTAPTAFPSAGLGPTTPSRTRPSCRSRSSTRPTTRGRKSGARSRPTSDPAPGPHARRHWFRPVPSSRAFGRRSGVFVHRGSRRRADAGAERGGRTMRRRLMTMLATGLVTLLMCSVGSVAPAGARTTGVGQGCPLPTFGPGAQYHPRIDPTQFSARVTNAWFPLTPGTTLVYQGVKDREAAVDIVTTSVRTKLIDHVRTRVVQDRLFLDGRLAERTADY